MKGGFGPQWGKVATIWAKLALSHCGIGPNWAKWALSGPSWHYPRVDRGQEGAKVVKTSPMATNSKGGSEVNMSTYSLSAGHLRRNGSANLVYDIYIYIYHRLNLLTHSYGGDRLINCKLTCWPQIHPSNSSPWARFWPLLPLLGPYPPLDSANLAQIVPTLPNLAQFHSGIVPTSPR